MELWRKFLRGHVYAIILNDWLRFMLPVGISYLSACIIVVLFTAIRHSGIPGWITFLFGFLGLTMFLIMMKLCEEGLVALRLMEEALGRITSTKHPFYARLEPSDRLFYRKLAKATRKPKIEIGPFMEFSLQVSIGIWEETINQLLSLLSY